MLDTPRIAALDDTRGAKGGPKRLRRAPIALSVLAAMVTAGIFWSGADVPRAHAEANAAATIDTPYGRAPLSFADLVDKVKPSVVSISVVNDGGAAKVAERGKGFAIPELPEDHPLHDFFKNLPKEFGQGEGGAPRAHPVQAQGSGFVVSEDGFVVTNNHVIDGATKIQVQFDLGEKYDAKLVGTDQRTDIALLKIENAKTTFPAVKLSKKQPRVGDWALAVGNPFGLGGTVTAGIVSALARDIGSGPYDYLQIDAAVNRGNSGGPTFNLDGEVIGVNTAIYSPSGGNVGIAFAVPANTVSDVVEQLKKGGSVSRGWLGVKIQNVDDDTAASLGLTEARGALVSEVTAGGPAASAGIKTQDAILQINADKIADSRDLARKIAEFSPDTTVDVKVWRGNEEKLIKVKLGLFPNSTDPMKPVEEEKPAKSSLDLSQLGVTLMPARSGDEQGVVIAEVDPSSDAAEKGLKPGDIILEISGDTVADPKDVVSGVKKAQELKRSAVLLHVKSGDQKRLVAVLLKDKKG
ncbi:MAG: Do family serine endopeptidase [Hyphomicrobiaceae bacterium]